MEYATKIARIGARACSADESGVRVRERIDSLERCFDLVHELDLHGRGSAYFTRNEDRSVNGYAEWLDAHGDKRVVELERPCHSVEAAAHAMSWQLQDEYARMRCGADPRVAPNRQVLSWHRHMPSLVGTGQRADWLTVATGVLAGAIACELLIAVVEALR